MSGGTKQQFKQFSITCAEDACLVLGMLISGMTVNLEKYKEYASEAESLLESTQEEYVPAKEYDDVNDKLLYRQREILKFTADHQSSSFSYIDLRKILEKHKYISSPLSEEMSAILSEFLDVRNWTFHNPQSLMVAAKEVAHKDIPDELKEIAQVTPQLNPVLIRKICRYELVMLASLNFILVLTPERLLYLLISKPDLQIDYLFIDEAHKLSGKNSRGPFYYKTVDMLLKRKKKPHFVFASPNIPNPEVYLKLLTDIETDGDDSHLCSTFSPVAQIKFSIDLNNFTVSVYKDHTGELDYLAEIKDRNASLVSFLLMFERINREIPFERKQQTIVYCNGRSKAIENALAFADQLSEIQDNDLNALARDITNEVHGDYYLAQIIKKGVAYHIGYLPAAIRMRIEDMFRRGKITTIFCTSTLLEGVNLPADNLFITDNKIFRKVMTPVDFRNLIGRVGRIRFNLYGNVFFVSQGEKLKQEDYVDLLKKEVPKQTLSIEAGPKSLTNAEKKYVVEALLQGNIELVKRNDAQSEEAYVMMRKFALILLRDIMQDNDSLVRREFSNLLTPKDEAKIREAFTDPFTEPDDDINTSVDQTKNLRAAIAIGLKYPDRVDGRFNYDDVLAFLEKLSRIFKWGKYEASTLGKPTLLRWYAVVLIQWMEGTGLSNIMKKALEYRQQHRDNFWVNRGQKEYYDDGLRHRNIVFADTLEVIDNIVLFSISNYFLRFSNEYKTVHQLKEFDNNWYEFVEYGTTNPITILLQRNGFSREVSTYIRNNKDVVGKVQELNRENFAVRQHLKYAELYSNSDNYNALTYEDTLLMGQELAPLITPEEDDAKALRFDALIYGIELAYLVGKKYGKARSDLFKKVSAVASVANIPEIMAQAELIDKILHTDYVENAGINEFEHIRENLRDLIKYIPVSKVHYDTNFDDEILSVDWKESELENDDLKNYKAKAEFYVRQHMDDVVIAKLKSNVPLTAEDVQALEKALWNEVGTKQDYEAEYGQKPLGEFVREIVGLDMNAAKEAFAQYLNDASLDSRQIYFVNQIVEYIVHNGMMKDLSVLQEAPFTDHGSIVEVFTDLTVWMGIRNTIEKINSNAVA